MKKKRTLDAVLKSILKPTTKHYAAKYTLRTLCDHLQTALNSGTKQYIIVSLQPHSNSQNSTQYAVVLQIPERRYEDTVFTANIPHTGWPVSLNWSGATGGIIASNQTQIEDAVMSIISRPEILSRFQDYCYLAQKC